MSANLIKIENQNNSGGSSVTGINAIVHKVGGVEKFKMVFDTTSTSGKTMNVTGDILPTTDNAYKLGSGTLRWSHIFQGTSSLYMGDDGVLTVSKGKMVIKNRKDGNLFPPPLWHQKHALFKYGIKTSVQQDPLTRKTRNYIGTIQYDEKVGTFTDASPDTFTIQDTSSSAESEENNFYKDWYITTTGTVGSATTIYGRIAGYTASSKTLSVANWYSDSSHTTSVTVTAIPSNPLFNLKSPAAYSSQTQTKLNELTITGTITSVTSQTEFVLNATSGTLSTTNDFYNKIYILKVTNNSGTNYFAKVTDWVGSSKTIKVKTSNPWHDDFSLNIVSSPSITTSFTFTLIAFKIRLVDLNIENMLNILEKDVPNAQDYKKHGGFGTTFFDANTNKTSFTTTTLSTAPWDDYNTYDTEGNITSTYDIDTGAFKSGSAIDFYSNDYNVGTGYSTTALGESSTFRNIGINQTTGISGGTYNTIKINIPSNDDNALSTTTDYTGYELQIKDTSGAIEYNTVVSSTTETINYNGDSTHIQLTVSFPFYSKPTTSHQYLLVGFVNASQEMGGDTGYSDSNQSVNIDSLNYQIKLESTAIAQDDYYNGFKITVEVYNTSTYITTSIYGTVTDYDGESKVITISNSTYSGGGIQWTDEVSGIRATVTPSSIGYEYYILEKSGGNADYQSTYYEAGTINYDPMKTFQDADYNNLSAAIDDGMDTQLYKYMETIKADADALNFDQFDASNAVAYNWSDYFFESKNWYGSSNSMYTDEITVIGTETPPTGSLYCKLSVYGSLKSRVFLSVPSDTSSNNIKKITKDYENKGYIFCKGLYITNKNLNNIALRSNDITLSDGGLYVEGSTTMGTINTGTLNVGGGYGSTGVTINNVGNIQADGDITATSVTTVSDRKLKENIQPIDNNELFMKLKPVSFNWKKDKIKKTVIGFIAQDVQEIFPDMVKTNDRYTLSIDYIQLIPLLVKQIQSLTKQLNYITQILQKK